MKPELKEAYDALKKAEDDIAKFAKPYHDVERQARNIVLSLERDSHKEKFDTIKGKLFLRDWSVGATPPGRVMTVSVLSERWNMRIIQLIKPIECYDFHEYASCVVKKLEIQILTNGKDVEILDSIVFKRDTQRVDSFFDKELHIPISEYQNGAWETEIWPKIEKVAKEAFLTLKEE